MIRGVVTPDNEAIIQITVVNHDGVEARLSVAVDTGFTDYLTLPPDVVDALQLPWRNTITVYLAGNAEATFDLHAVTILWDGEPRSILAYKADGAPLVGMSMLRGCLLTLEGVDGGEVLIRPL